MRVLPFVCCLVVACGGANRDEVVDVSWLAEALGETHAKVEMTLEISGHLTIELDTPTGPRPFLVDTAASVNLVTEELASSLSSEPGSRGLPVFFGLSLGEEPLDPFEATRADLGPAIEGVVGAGGIVGAPFLLERHAVIDYPSRTLFLGGRPRAAASAIRAAAADQPWVEIPVERDLIGFLSLEGGIGPDTGLHVVVDTGAPEPLVTLATAERLGLPLEPFDGGFGTLGGAVDSFVTEIVNLRLGEETLPGSRILVLDLSGINDLLGDAGLPAIDVLVGGALLDQYDGIVDYTGDAMFLRE